MTQQRTDSLGMAALVVVGLGSGSAFMFTKIAVEELGPFQLVLGRVSLALLPVLLVMAFSGPLPRITPALLRGVTILALLDSVVPMLLIAWAGSRIESSTSAVLVSTMPLFTVAIAAAAGQRESVSAPTVLGLAVGFGGVLVLAGPGALDGSSSNAGLAAVLLASLCYAAGAVYAKNLLRATDPVSLTGLKLAASVVLVAPVALPLEGVAAYGTMSFDTLAAVVILGFGTTGLGRCVYLWIVQRYGSVQASLVTYIVPVVALFLGWAVMDEAMGAAKLAGAVLIVLGVVGVSYGRLLLLRLAERLRHMAGPSPMAAPTVVERPRRN